MGWQSYSDASKKIVDQDTKVQWTLTTSRRTPESFLQLLEGLEIEIVPFEETDATWLLELYKHLENMGNTR